MRNLSAISRLLFLSACVVAVSAPPSLALDVTDINANMALRRQAMHLFEGGKSDEAANLLAQGFRVDYADSRGAAAVADELLSESILLDGEHRHKEASAAAASAVKAINAIPADGRGDVDRGRVLCDYGLVCELVLKQPADAIKYYEAGLKLSPHHSVALERLAALKRAMGTN